MSRDSHEGDLASSEQLALSPAETEAIGILESYGIDSIPVYIGRARRELWLRRIEKGGPAPGAQDIVDEIIALRNFDEEQRKWLEWAKENKAIANLYDTITLSEPDRIATQDVANALRELVEIERAKHFVRPPASETELIRASLYPNSESKEADPCYLAKIQVLGRQVIVRAWPGKDFVNLELEVR